MAQTVAKVQLKPETLQAFEAYIGDAEAEMEQPSQGKARSSWSEASTGRTEQLLAGSILAQFWPEEGPVKVDHGLIHDWIGAVWIDGATVEQTVRLVQDYNNHKNIYKPEVIDSKLLSHRGGNFKIYMRLLKKKIITVVLDTYHDVHYSTLNSTHCLCRSYTTRILEVEKAGGPNETIMPPDIGYGFLWRLYSYWSFQQKESGVMVECRAISLSRNVPLGLGWMIEPIIQKLPRESLIKTLEDTRQTLTRTVGQGSKSP
ncbi:MAG: hypothetical protein ABSD13_04635 [Candidatus Korobacteraceae bacterium]|jgi:hypothetical protein